MSESQIVRHPETRQSNDNTDGKYIECDISQAASHQTRRFESILIKTNMWFDCISILAPSLMTRYNIMLIETNILFDSPRPHTRHTEGLGWSNKIFLELSEIQWNKFYGPWKENFTRNENLPTDPRITRTTLHYNVLNWSVSFISSSLCSNEFILPLGREVISFQIILSKERVI